QADAARDVAKQPRDVGRDAQVRLSAAARCRSRHLSPLAARRGPPAAATLASPPPGLSSARAGRPTGVALTAPRQNLDDSLRIVAGDQLDGVAVRAHREQEAGGVAEELVAVARGLARRAAVEAGAQRRLELARVRRAVPLAAPYQERPRAHVVEPPGVAAPALGGALRARLEQRAQQQLAERSRREQ